MEAGIFAELGADVALKREIMVVAAAWLRTLRLSVRARREMFRRIRHAVGRTRW
jgi:hypothetical protein